MKALLLERFIQGTLLLAALIHLAPVSGIAGGEALQRLYGIETNDPALLLLLRHRAVLFALVGVPLLIAITVPGWRLPALAAATVSTASFVLLAAPDFAFARPLLRVIQIDAALLAFLGAALLAVWHQRSST